MVYDIATGKGTAITSDPIADSAPAWSADGKQLAFVASITGGNYSAIYARAADGAVAAILIYRHTAGETAVLTDWSPGGTLCFWAGDWTYALSTSGTANTPLRLVRGRGGRLAFNSNESGLFEVYTVPLNPSVGTPVQVSKRGAIAGLFWWGWQGVVLPGESRPGAQRLAI